MKVKTLKALRGSIKKWENIVAGTGTDEGPDNCPLCRLFNNGSEEIMCMGCPVFEATGDDGCGKTPYVEFSAAKGLFDAMGMKHHAIAELNFLKSLLPPADADRARGK